MFGARPGVAGLALRSHLTGGRGVLRAHGHGVDGLQAGFHQVEDAVARSGFLRGVGLVQQGRHGVVDLFEEGQLSVGGDLVEEPLQLVKAVVPFALADGTAEVAFKGLALGVNIGHHAFAKLSVVARDAEEQVEITHNPIALFSIQG